MKPTSDVIIIKPKIIAVNFLLKLILLLKINIKINIKIPFKAFDRSLINNNIIKKIKDVTNIYENFFFFY